jgi:hypothetical protein
MAVPAMAVATVPMTCLAVAGMIVVMMIVMVIVAMRMAMVIGVAGKIVGAGHAA